MSSSVINLGASRKRCIFLGH